MQSYDDKYIQMFYVKFYAMNYQVSPLSSVAERSLSKRKVGGSIPPVGSLFL